jgi:hypothetical protein
MRSVLNRSGILLLNLFLLTTCFKLEAGPVYINEILASNSAYYAGLATYVDWIEIYNTSQAPIDLGGYFLTDDRSEPDKWKIPSGTVIPAGGYKVFYADEKNYDLHTNFKLSGEGEFTGIYDPGKNVADSLTYSHQRNNISFGRSASDISRLGFFSKPSPGFSNGEITYPSILEKPAFSHSGGFYSSSVSVTLSSEEGSIIRYTTDGSEPLSTSPVYMEPIVVDTTTCIRAKSFKTGLLESEISTYTFFIGVNKNLPVISLVTNHENFFSDTIGIYVIGTNGIRAGCSSTPMNLNQDWERPVNVELFDEQGNVLINQLTGIRIFGGCSRQRYPIKSFEVFARKQYGKGSFECKLFKDENITEFESFLIRSSSDDQMMTMFRDGLGHTLVDNLEVENQAFQPAVVFINGQYWGIHNIREKYNEAYFEEHYGITEDNLNVIKNNPSVSSNVENGSASHYLNMLNYLAAHSNAPDIYDYMNRQMDIESFIDYMAAQIYLSADDWPGNNIRYWRAGNGRYNRWRWVCYDMDQVVRSNNTRWNSILLATTPYNGNSWPNPPWSVVLFNNLLKGNRFRNEFLNRITFLMNTTFSPDRIIHLVDSLQGIIRDEMPFHIRRWGGQLVNDPLRESWIRPLPSSMDEWEMHVQTMRNFAVTRPDTAINMLRRYFKLSNTVIAEVTNQDPEYGYLYMGPKVIPHAAHSGRYFTGLPLDLTARPKPGYRFSRWEISREGLPLITEASARISFVLTKNTFFKAFFEPDTVGTAPVIINEVNYHSSDEADAADWVELHNRAAYDVDISGWIMKDDQDDHTFVIPENIIMPVSSYFVLCEDTSLFKKQFPLVRNRTGNFSFGLGNGGDCIRLYNQYMLFVDSLNYSDDDPWPPLADGDGRSLSLLKSYLDNDLPLSWTDLCWLTPGSKNALISDGPLSVTDPVMDPDNGDYILYQNYPNPCHSVTSIEFSLKKGGDISLEVYDLSGRKIMTLVDEFMNPDNYKVTITLERLKPGIYYYALKAGNAVVTTRKMIVF